MIYNFIMIFDVIIDPTSTPPSMPAGVDGNYVLPTILISIGVLAIAAIILIMVLLAKRRKI